MDFRRRNSYTTEEKHLLTSLLEKYNAGECNKADEGTAEDRLTAWRKISREFNSRNHNSQRSIDSLQKQWSYIKRDPKKHKMSEKRPLSGTSEDRSKLSENDNEMTLLSADNISADLDHCDEGPTPQRLYTPPVTPTIRMDAETSCDIPLPPQQPSALPRKKKKVRTSEDFDVDSIKKAVAEEHLGIIRDERHFKEQFFKAHLQHKNAIYQLELAFRKSLFDAELERFQNS